MTAGGARAGPRPGSSRCGVAALVAVGVRAGGSGSPPQFPPCGVSVEVIPAAPGQEVSAMFVQPVDPLLVPAVWRELAVLAAAWLCVAGACAAASLLLAGRLGWLR